MSQIYFFNNPFDASSREVQSRMAFLDIPFNMVDRLGPAMNMGFHISFLPTIIIADAQNNEVARMEDATQMSNDNVTAFWNKYKTPN